MGHILRLKDKRLIKQTLKVIYDNQQDGDILMDVEDKSWQQLQEQAADKNGWRAKVHVLKNKARRATAPNKPRRTAQALAAILKTKTRFTFKLPAKNAKENNNKKKKKKKISNKEARKRHYVKACKKAE